MYKELLTPEELKALLSSEEVETLESPSSTTHFNSLLQEMERMSEELSRMAQLVHKLSNRVEMLEKREQGPTSLQPQLQDHGLELVQEAKTEHEAAEADAAPPLTSRLERYGRKKERSGKWF